MVREPGSTTSASPGPKTMIRTIQCPNCGVMLNVPESAAGRRLKCPHCQSKFAAPAADPGDSAIAEPSAGSSFMPTRGPSSGSFELPRSPRESSGSLELPASPAPLRETFDLPLLSEDLPKPPSANPKSDPAGTADVLGLFQDEPKSSRRPKGAEARARARRCPSCGGVVGVGMSLCNTCGLDLDTGQRVVVDILEDEMPVAIRPSAPSMGVVFIGALCAVGFLLLSVISVVAWLKGQEGAQFLLIVWLFGIYGSAQFLRRKSMRPLFISLSLAAGIGAVTLIALPIFKANMPTAAPPLPETGFIDPEAPHIRPITDRLDMTSISWGIFMLLGYAGLSVYLNSPTIRREFRR